MVNLLEVPVGARVLLTTGEVVEVMDNPMDGQWLIVEVGGDTELRHAQDIVAVAR